MRNRYLVWLLIALTILFVVAVWLDLTPLLRGPAEWRWNLRQLSQPIWRILIPILFLVLYVGLCARWIAAFGISQQPPPPKSERAFLIFLTIATPLIQFALAAAVLRLPLFQFYSATVSPAVTGFYSVAVATPDLSEQLAHYTTIMPTLPIHPQTHPPGIVLLQWLSWRFFQTVPAFADTVALPLRTLQCHNAALMTLDNTQIASAVTGMLVPVIGGFAVWPIYAFGRRIVGPQTAATVAALFPILPLFAMWPSQWDQVYPLLLFLGLYLVHTGLESRSAGRVFAAGVVLSIATFLSVGNAVLVVIVGLYGSVWYLGHRVKCSLISFRGIVDWGRWVVLLALGCASIWSLYAVLYRVSLLELLSVGSRLAAESTRCPICPSTTRSYGLWAVWNIVDFATFFSVPLAILLLGRIPRIVTAIRAYLKGDLQTYSIWAPLAVAALMSFVVLDVSGIVRAEVGRMWVYFGPLLALIALAPGKVSSSESTGGLKPYLVTGLVALQLITLNTRWIVTPSFLDEPPERLVSYIAPGPQTILQASFDRQLALIGYDISKSDVSLDLTLYWQALVQPLHAYTMFVHVLDAKGQLVAQQDNMPVHDQLPTSCWQPGEFVSDPYSVNIPRNVQKPLVIELGVYRVDTGERLNLDGGVETSVRLNLP